MPLPQLGVDVSVRVLPAQIEEEAALADIVGLELTVTEEVVPMPVQPLLSVTVTE